MNIYISCQFDSVHYVVFTVLVRFDRLCLANEHYQEQFNLLAHFTRFALAFSLVLLLCDA